MMKHRHAFPFDVEANHVMQAFGNEVKALLRLNQEAFVDPQNIQRFRHGRTWQSHQSYAPDRVSELNSHEHKVGIRIDDIILGRVAIIQKEITNLAIAMSESFARAMFSTISETCETHGNVVHGGDGPAKAFIDMLEKIEFGVDRNGQVSLPQVFGGPGLNEKFTRDTTMNTAEYKALIDEIIERKSKDALLREAARKEKFSKRA